MNTDAMKREPEVYTRSDFEQMGESQLFGFWACMKLDRISTPSPEDYATIYSEFRLGNRHYQTDVLAMARIRK